MRELEKFPKTTSLKFRLSRQIGGFLAVAMIIMAAVAVFIHQDAVKKLTMENLQSQNIEYQREIERMLTMLQDRLKTLSSNRFIINSLVDKEGQSRHLKQIISNIVEQEDVSGAAVLAYDGQIILGTLTKVDHPDQLRKVISTWDVNMHFHDEQLVMLAPIIYYNTVQGALLVKYDLDSIIKKVIYLDEDHLFKLYRGDKLIYEHHNKSQDKKFFTIRSSFQKTNVLFNYLNLSVESGLPLKIITERLHYTSAKLATIACLIILLAMLFTFRIGLNLSRPVLELCAKVEALKTDNSVRCSPTGTNDELERLALTVDEMNGDLRALLAELEERVLERTSALQESNDMLLQKIKEHREAVKIAEAATNTKSEFLANMSHEIRTPMNAIIGLTELALEHDPETKVRDYLQKINRSSSFLLTIINDILDFSKIEAGKLTIDQFHFKLSNLVSTLTSIFSSSAHDKNINFDVSLDARLPSAVQGDMFRLNQVLINLISNAVKFTEKGGVQVSIEKKEKTAERVKIRFSVSDTGIGMDKETIYKILSPFSQADSSTTRKYGGTGLGLTISYQLIELMGGELQVESSPGEGSTFSFSLDMPLGDESQCRSDGNTTIADNITNRLQGVSILLVEDNLINQQVAREQLKKLGLAIDVANNGLEALDAVKKKEYAAILMDIQMPEMDGYQATVAIRDYEAQQQQSGHKRHVPIIAMTAHAMPEDRAKCIEVGMDAHVSKPIDTNLLYQTLLQWIEGINLRSQKRSRSPLSSVDDSIALPESLPGIKLHAGLDNLNGDEILYRTLLKNFKVDYVDVSTDIKKALEMADVEKACFLLHSLKGVAANLGIFELSQAAESIYELIKKEGTLTDIEKEIKDLIVKQDQVNNSIASLQENEKTDKGPTSVLDLDELHQQIDQLLALLEKNDFKAVSQFKNIEESLCILFEKIDVRKLARQIEAYKFIEAREHLVSFRNE